MGRWLDRWVGKKIPFQATLEPQNPAQRAPGGKSAAFLHQCQGLLCSYPLPEEGNSGQGGILRPLSPQLFPPPSREGEKAALDSTPSRERSKASLGPEPADEATEIDLLSESRHTEQSLGT